jgi:iron complex transport system substrate-binding protein
MKIADAIFIVKRKADTMHAPERIIPIILVILLGISVPMAAAQVTVTDDMGTTVTINGTPQRIISLSPSNTEILYALGLGDRVVGVTEYCNYPPEALDKPKIGGFNTVNIEKVIALRPDLIVAAFGNGEATINNLRSLGYTVVSLDPGTLEDVLGNIRLVGQVTGAGDNATRLAGDLEQRIDAVEERIGATKDRPKVAHVIWNDPIYVSGNGTFQDELIKLAGGENAFRRVEGWNVAGIEDFIRVDPDVLIVNKGTGMGGQEDIIVQFFRSEPRFSGVSAIRNNRIYPVDTDMVDRAAPRIVDVLEQFAEDIHPVQSGVTPAPYSTQKTAEGPGFEFTAAVGACVAAAFLLLRRSGK